jgi:hypothetical protein
MLNKTDGGYYEWCGDLINCMIGCEMIDRTYRPPRGRDIEQNIYFHFFCHVCGPSFGEWLSESDDDISYPAAADLKLSDLV